MRSIRIRNEAVNSPCRPSTGAGMDGLLAGLTSAAREALSGGETALVTRARHRHDLEEVLQMLDRTLAAEPDSPIEFIAEDLRLALRAIGRLTGCVDIDEVYDLIFREFCIGK